MFGRVSSREIELGCILQHSILPRRASSSYTHVEVGSRFFDLIAPKFESVKRSDNEIGCSRSNPKHWLGGWLLYMQSKVVIHDQLMAVDVSSDQSVCPAQALTNLLDYA